MKSDLEIKHDIIEELKWEPFLNSGDISVNVRNGIVTLSGSVDAYSKKTSAENLTKKINGVRAIVEEIEVNIPSIYIMCDSEIAEAILNAISWNSSLCDETILVKIESGIVTLEGNVSWEFQRNSVRLLVEDISGVMGIENKIKLKTRVSPNDIKQKIIAAFHRSAIIDSKNVDIEIVGSKAILKGIVRSWSEKEDAEKAVFSAIGIDIVDNRIEVDCGGLML